MKQILHLLVIDAACERVLGNELASKWLVPCFCCPERARAPEAGTRLLARNGVHVDVAGQWFGRLSRDVRSIDWLLVARARASVESGRLLSWLPFDRLLTSAALLDYQEWAIARAHRGGTIGGPGPFGALTFLGEVRNWIREVTSDATIGDATIYRASAWEVVLGVAAGRRRVFFKALTPERSPEAMVTSRLSESFPGAFARTLALSKRADGTAWWLTDACDGRALSECLTPTVVTRCISAFARIQQSLAERHTLALGLPRLDLGAVTSWTTSWLDEAREGEAVEIVDRALREIARTDLPRRWIPLDLDPANVIVHSDGEAFIDLDDSFVGPGPLAAAIFARRVAELSNSTGASVQLACIYEAYEAAAGMRLGAHTWRALDIAACVTRAHLGWERLCLAASRGEIQGELAAVRTRLAQKLGAAIRSSDVLRRRQFCVPFEGSGVEA